MCFMLNQHGGHSPFSPLFPGPSTGTSSLPFQICINFSDRPGAHPADGVARRSETV